MNSDLITEIKSSKSAPLFGFWYPALLSGKLRPGTMHPLLMLGLPILLCRDRQGKVSAMRDLCPHRGMPLSCGRFDGERVECAYHGWQFDMKGRCQLIPALVNDTALQTEKICVTSYPCEERDGYVWVFIPDSREGSRPLPEIPRLPIPSEPYRMFHYSTTLQCSIDDGVIGLLDPAHGPFVHQSPYWRSPRGSHEKTKSYEPIPGGFRMTTHTPSRNSTPYKLLRLVSGGDLTTTIDFILPGQRFELLQCGSIWVSMRAIVTPLTEQECRIDFCAAWNFIRWVPFVTPLFRFFARIFLNQDKQAMEQQTIGLRYKPPMMLIGDADMPTKWYLKLKAAHLASVQTGQPIDHPLKGPVTLRWRT